MVKQFDTLVFIGRFTPFHKGHLAVLEEAAGQADQVVILIGSADAPRSIRNPFTYAERAKVIFESLPKFEGVTFTIRPIQDIPYNNSLWVKQIYDIINEVTDQWDKIGLIGHNKDHSSFYLKLFPKWDSVAVGAFYAGDQVLSSTVVREIFFDSKNEFRGINILPRASLDFLYRFKETPEYQDLVKEQEYINNYKKSWASAPFPPIFMTVDAVCVQAGHVLLIRRRDAPGRGLWAMPGGFINQYETLEDAVVRELHEETNIDIPMGVLHNKIKARRIFDNPHRSDRGRTITQAFLFDLNDEITRKISSGKLVTTISGKSFTSAVGMTKVKGSDDADKAVWVPIASLKRNQLFEDHWDVIHEMLEEMK
jgi:bifunctional NMN adenylyltransferase/nudix hydrolase